MTMPFSEAAPIQVVGVGLSGASSLAESSVDIIRSATLLMGSQRLIETIQETLWDDPESALPSALPVERPEIWVMRSNFTQVFDDLRSRLQSHPSTRAVILATGDPLFFGLGRLLLSAFPPAQLVFYPQVSAMQLAFSRLKMPWQDATLVSVHGRGESLLTRALKRGDEKIAVLTDGVLTPQAIASLIAALDLPIRYQLWVCENLGGTDERVARYDPVRRINDEVTFAALNVVVLLRSPVETMPAVLPQSLPLIGLPDAVFEGYPDRPTLMTKREIRLLILGAIAPLNQQVIWDVGAGTGSVSVELSRLCPQASIYAIEKTAMGAALVARNAKRLAIAPIHVIHGKAPNAFVDLPNPARVFIGGSSGQLVTILNHLRHLQVPRIVVALATVEHLAELTCWASQPHISKDYQYQLTQANISRSLPVGPLTRLSPLNPVTLITLSSVDRSEQL
ncbi:MAG: precorrin-6y C5,15-methyltransferase (decarboxylating) subunit CbiE [Cyanobacteria bacterium P01_D01_bin.36]